MHQQKLWSECADAQADFKSPLCAPVRKYCLWSCRLLYVIKNFKMQEIMNKLIWYGNGQQQSFFARGLSHCLSSKIEFMGTEKSQPEGPTFKWETRLDEFPTGAVDPMISIFVSSLKISDRFFFSHATKKRCPLLSLLTRKCGTICRKKKIDKTN